jgi:membrane-associated phospholipid phosphatase
MPRGGRGGLQTRPRQAGRPYARYGLRVRGRAVGYVLWLLALAAVQVLAFVAIWRFSVYTEHGQLLDTIALAGNSIGRQRIDELIGTVLNAMSVVSLALATAVIGFIALIRGRILLAVVAMLLIVGANGTTQALKYLIVRPDLGVDSARAAAGNSLPSGHTAVAASVAIALVLVLPSKVRGLGALIGAGYMALAGVATLSAGWHRPSDAIAALLLVGAWAAVGGTLLVVNRSDAFDEPQPVHWFAVTVLAVAGAVLLAVAAVALGLTDQVVHVPVRDLSRTRLLTAYAGGAAGIAGTAAVVMALVLLTVHRVVPRRPLHAHGQPAQGYAATGQLVGGESATDGMG